VHQKDGAQRGRIGRSESLRIDLLERTLVQELLIVTVVK
jgi:hypothetical protein